jgi:hypothetical protein
LSSRVFLFNSAFRSLPVFSLFLSFNNEESWDWGKLLGSTEVGEISSGTNISTGGCPKEVNVFNENPTRKRKLKTNLQRIKDIMLVIKGKL